MSASLGLSPVLSPTLSPIWSLMLCPPRWSCLSLVCGLVSGLVCHLGWDAVSASLGCLRFCLPLSTSLVLSFSCLWSCLPAFVFVLSRSLSFIWDVSAPPGLVFFLVSGLVSQLVSHLVFDAVSASLVLSFSCLRSCLRPCLPSWLGCCVRLAGLSPVLSQLVSHLVWDAVSASLVLSFSCLRSCPWSCLPSWLGCCVRLAGLVSQFVSHLALSFTLAGVLCPPRWACLPICLPICLPSGFVFQLGWGAVSASLGLSPVLLPNLFPTWLCLSRWLGCCVRLAGLVSQFVSQFVSHLALSFTLAGVLCPPRWACHPICLPVFSPHLFPIWLCL